MEVHPLLQPFYHLVDHRERIFLLYLATSFLLAIAVHLYDRRRQFAWTFGAAESSPHIPDTSPLREIFPKEVYTHPSAINDLFFFICNVVLYAFIIAPFQFFGVFFSEQVFSLISNVSIPAVPSGAPSGISVFFVGVFLAMVSDFGTYLAHLLAHRVRFLWEFHKVHHSAAVLTPISVYRMHPVDDVFTLILGGVLTGTADAIIRFFFMPNIPPFVLFGVNAVVFVFYLTGYHLRHSHVWLSYGPRLSRFLISPAQHQIHHSVSKPHWDKNFGFVFAVWDWMFGTLYVPKVRENLTFGIGRGEEAEYSSVFRLYLLPFRKAWKVLRK